MREGSALVEIAWPTRGWYFFYADSGKWYFHVKLLLVIQDLFRSQTKLREGNVFTPVCHSVHRGCIPECNGQTPP